jgi:hypothetical protein
MRTENLVRTLGKIVKSSPDKDEIPAASHLNPPLFRSV